MGEVGLESPLLHLESNVNKLFNMGLMRQYAHV